MRHKLSNLKHISILLLIIIFAVLSSISVFSVELNQCNQLCKEKCDKSEECETFTPIINSEGKCNCILESESRTATPLAFILVPIFFLTVIAVLLYIPNKSIGVKFIFMGIFITFSGLVFLFSPLFSTIVNLGSIDSDFKSVSLMNANSLCNIPILSQIGEVFSETYRSACNWINFLFWGVIIITFIGISLLIIGLAKLEHKTKK